ncbi:MAG: hypothetical protein RIR43_2273, partial [Pseudomonadota bacterium]
AASAAASAALSAPTMPLSSQGVQSITAQALSTGAQAPESGGGAGLQWAVRHSELRVIQDAIRNTSSREAAARLLGISPRTLRYKLAQMRDLGMMTAESVG